MPQFEKKILFIKNIIFEKFSYTTFRYLKNILRVLF